MDNKSCMKDKEDFPIWKRRWKEFLLIGLIFLSIFLWFGPFLIKWTLIYETPVIPAEVLLLDQSGQSLKTAVQLFQDGMVQKILITDGIPDQYRGIQAPIYKEYRIKQALESAGIPDSAIASFPRQPDSRLERQIYLRKWILDHDIHSYMIFTGSLSTRYEKMIHDQTFAEGDVHLIMYTSTGKIILRKQLLAIQNTLIRFVYWNLFYRSKLNSS